MKEPDAPGTRYQLIIDAMVAMEFRDDFQAWYDPQQVLDEIMRQNEHRSTLLSHYDRKIISLAMVRLESKGCLSRRRKQRQKAYEYQINWDPRKWETTMATPWKRTRVAFAAAGYKHEPKARK